MMLGDGEVTRGSRACQSFCQWKEYSRSLVQAVEKGVEKSILELWRGQFQVRATVATNLALGE